MKLEQLQTNTALRGIVPDALVTVVNVQWFGSEALELTYKTAGDRRTTWITEYLIKHDEDIDLIAGHHSEEGCLLGDGRNAPPTVCRFRWCGRTRPARPRERPA